MLAHHLCQRSRMLGLLDDSFDVIESLDDVRMARMGEVGMRRCALAVLSGKIGARLVCGAMRLRCFCHKNDLTEP